jgi:hypothetical protein
VYPVGQTHVWVDDESLADARELLLSDAVEEVFDEGPEIGPTVEDELEEG